MVKLADLQEIKNTAQPTAGMGLVVDLNGLIPTTVLPVWQSYVPVWTSSGTAPTIGNATVAGRFSQIGKTVVATASVSFGTTSLFGTGTYFFSLPVAAAAAPSMLGTARLFDFSSGFQGHAHTRLASTTTVQFEYLTANTTTAAGLAAQLTPWTWAVSDQIDFIATYEAA